MCRYVPDYSTDDEAISAEYTNGVLEVRLPTAETTARGKEIPLEG
ncbi:Hsp20 family protein [Natrinema salifodinae]|nr:Hsp20/alpha crystallin family protein [Natrinema salifodinae]